MAMKRFFSLLIVVCTVALSAQNTKYVNLFMGTSGDNGQLAPGATVPFGVVCVCPDSDPRTHAGYNYEVTKVTGISINRLSGVGCSGGGGNIRIRLLAPNEELHIDKQTEVAVPENGNKLNIQVQGRKQKNMPIRSVSFNGREVKDFRISHNDLIKGGKLVFHY
jgi:putative alpha-1,2-mannosidase